MTSRSLKPLRVVTELPPDYPPAMFTSPASSFFLDDCSTQSLICILSCILEGVMKRQDRLHPLSCISRFTSLRKPSISIQDYIERIYTYTLCSPECLVLSLVYIDRLIQSQTVVVNSLSIHRVLLTSIMIAAKFFDDSFFKNEFYARVGGIETSELNILEQEYLCSINFSLVVSPEDYQQYHNELFKHTVNDMCPCCCGLMIPFLTTCPESHDILIYEYPKQVIPDSPCNVVY